MSDPTPLEIRLMRRTVYNPETGCMEWVGTLAYGYGIITDHGKRLRVHRLAYELARGEIQNGLEIDHLCRVRHCLNPDHLEAVTHAENTRRGVGFAGQNARKMSCHKGHPFAGQNTRGDRYCRTCDTERKRAWRAKQRA